MEERERPAAARSGWAAKREATIVLVSKDGGEGRSSRGCSVEVVLGYLCCLL